MSDVGTENIDLNVDRGTRSHIESAVATHTPGPDINSAVSGAVEQHARNIRKSNEASTPADRSDRLRATIRNAVKEAKDKAAAPSKKPVNGAEAPIGPPLSWSKDAKAAFDSLPHEVRMSALRGEKTFADAVTPIAERLNEIDRVMGPVRPLYQQAGLKSDGEAIQRLLHWENGLRDPNTRLQAYAALGQSLGIDPAALGQGQQQQPEHYSYQSLDPAAQQTAQRVEAFAQDKPAFQAVRYDMGRLLQENPQAFNGPTGEVDLDRLYQTALQYQQSQGAVQQTIAQFSQGKKHFEKVRVRMGHTLNSSGTRYLRSDGSVDLDACYRDACKAEGLSDSSNKRDVSPSSRSPSAALVTNERGKGIRASIKAAIQESRGRL